MTSHVTLTDKNEQIAQEAGVAFAQRLFNDFQNVKLQPFFFSWSGSGDFVKKLSSTGLFVHYGKGFEYSRNLDSICEDAALIEWNNLVQAAEHVLPLAVFSLNEYIERFKSYFDYFYDSLESEFKHKYMSDFPDNADNWKVAFTQVYTAAYVKKNAIEHLNELLAQKSFPDEDFIKEMVTEYINTIYSNIDQ